MAHAPLPKRIVERAEVAANEALPDGGFLLTLRAPRLSARIVPGQFVNLYVSSLDASLILPRPFSVLSTDGRAGTLEILGADVGAGTSLLRAARAGTALDLAGPLGNAFTPDPAARRWILVAGGVGLPPLYDLARRNPGRDIRLIYGARTASRLWAIDRARKACDVTATTEDGSTGTRGRVTDVLESMLDMDRGDGGMDAGSPPDSIQIFACGPMPMLHALARMARARGIPAQLAVEQVMACGYGICRGCGIELESAPGRRKYAMVCESGPVFDAREIRLPEH